MDNNENKGIWIPFEIWELADLSPMQRILLAKIHSLSHKDGSSGPGTSTSLRHWFALLNTSVKCGRICVRLITWLAKDTVIKGR